MKNRRALREWHSLRFSVSTKPRKKSCCAARNQTRAHFVHRDEMFFCLQSSAGEIKNANNVNCGGQAKKKKIKKLYRHTLEWQKLLRNFKEWEFRNKALIRIADL